MIAIAAVFSSSSLYAQVCPISPSGAIAQSERNLTRLGNTQFTMVNALTIFNRRQSIRFSAAREERRLVVLAIRQRVARRIRTHQRVNGIFQEARASFVAGGSRAPQGLCASTFFVDDQNANTREFFSAGRTIRAIRLSREVTNR